LPPGYAQQSFANAPSNALTLVCSPDGGSKSIKINQDVHLFLGKLPANGTVSHSLAGQRHAWMQLIEGDLELNGEKLSSGDGAAVDNETDLNLASKKGAHFLLFDLN